ncbi:MAG: hypothetical protein PHC62_08210 [Candidatus Izemoplasmatales bacterium]|jgi:hypothetical protein|nr:hypothetical protein [Candidatus Izemoplasmatales bacterium]
MKDTSTLTNPSKKRKLKTLIFILFLVGFVSAFVIYFIQNATLKAVVIQTGSSFILVEASDSNIDYGMYSLFISDKTKIMDVDGTFTSLDSIEEGDRVLVIFTGPIFESSPAKIEGVYIIKILK